MHQSTSGVTGPSAGPSTAPAAPSVDPRPSGRLGRLVLFGLGMVAIIGAAAALPLWLLG